jgi:hypothetical protein
MAIIMAIAREAGEPVMSSGRVFVSALGTYVDSCPVNAGESVERRTERAMFETERHLVVGDVTLPPEGYQSRFSDAINRGDLSFIPLTNVEITSIESGEVTKRDFVVVGKAHVQIAFPVDGDR